jgi:4-hydroxybenzoate polyprenyltransferase
MSERPANDSTPPANWKDYARILRPHQWLKNLLVFVPAFTAHRFDAASAQHCLLAFLSFSLCASSGYIFNDLRDIENDREHQTKRHRPFASGRINRRLGPPLLTATFAAAALASIYLPWNFFVALCGYYSLTLAYSIYLKRILVLDVVTLALLYGVRLAAGAAAVDVILSPWLLSFSTFLFLSLALIKRAAELAARQRQDGGAVHGRGYRPADLPILESMAASSAYVAALTSGLYISSPVVAQLYGNPERLWAIPVILLFWTSRILILTHRGEMLDDPVLFAARDRISLICGALMILVVFVSI